MADSRARYFEVLRNFCIDPDADAAVRESIVAAQQAGVQVVLMINPESTEYRSWYAPGAECAAGRLQPRTVRHLRRAGGGRYARGCRTGSSWMGIT